jgi:hypothetical protein
MNDRMKAHVVQTRRETDRHGQEITAAASSLLVSTEEHKVTIDSLSQEINKSKEYADSKFSKFVREIQNIKQHSAAEISKLSATLGDLQVKLVTGKSDNTSPAVPVSADVRSEAMLQVDSVLNAARSDNATPSVQGVNGVNGCTTSACDDVNTLNAELNPIYHLLALLGSATIVVVSPSNAELNPICHLLALLGGATIVVVSRLTVNGGSGKFMQ